MSFLINSLIFISASILTAVTVQAQTYTLSNFISFKAELDGKCQQRHGGQLVSVVNAHPFLRFTGLLQRRYDNKAQAGFIRIDLQPGESVELGCDRVNKKTEVQNWVVYREDSQAKDAPTAVVVAHEATNTSAEDDFLKPPSRDHYLNLRCAEFLNIPMREVYEPGTLVTTIIDYVNETERRAAWEAHNSRESAKSRDDLRYLLMLKIVVPLRKCLVVVKDEGIISAINAVNITDDFLYQ